MVVHTNSSATVLLASVVLSGCSVDASQSGSFPTPQIEFTPERYVVYRAGELPVIDGRLGESAWQAAPWTSDFVDIEGADRPRPRFRTRAKLLWSELYLFVGAELEEPDVWASITERDAVIYQDNDFEVFIDPDGDTHEYYELEINALGTEWDLFLVRPYRDGGPAINAWDIRGLLSAVHVTGTLNDPRDSDAGWSVEIAVPWRVLAEAANRPAPPKPGDQWKMNFSRVQWRTEIQNGRYRRLTESAPGRTRPEDNWVWSPQGLVNMHYPEMWGIVQFSDLLAGEGSEAFVSHEIDYVKWALRRVYYAEQNWHAEHGTYTSSLRRLNLGILGWPVSIEVTAGGFEATISHGGMATRIREDGKVWSADERPPT